MPVYRVALGSPSQYIVWLVCLAVLVGCDKEDEAARATSETVTARPAAPDFELRDLRGRDVRLSSYRGKVVVLNFWATWCAPCRVEAPSLQRLYAARGGEDLEMLAVSLDNKRDLVERFVSQYQLRFPVLLDPDRTAARAYAVNSLPVTLLIDREGRVAARIDGAHEWDDDEWQKVISGLLAEARATRPDGY